MAGDAHRPGRSGSLQLLGTPLLVGVDGTSHALNAVDAALLSLLALDGPTTRARVVALLWPEATEMAGRNALRQRLFRLRRAAGTDLVVQGEVLALADGVAHDLGAIEPALMADAHAAPGVPLAAHAGVGGEEFAEWRQRAQGGWRAARGDALATIAERLEAEDRLAAALPYAERLVRDEPLLESATRRVMRLHYRLGHRSAALAAYAALRAALQTELGETPDRETRDMFELVSGSETPAPPLAPQRPLAILRPPRLIGRDAEWGALASAWDARQWALVVGEPGIGKSRLLGDFCAARELPLIPTRPGDVRVPYALLTRVLRAVTAELPAEATPAWVVAELARLLPELGTAATTPADPLRLVRAAEWVLGAGSHAGLAIDDLQFADEASLELLPAICAASDGVHWCFAVRSGEVTAALARWFEAEGAPRVRRIELGPLDRAGVEALLASLSLPDLEPAQWAERLHRHTGGNPLFILETLLAVRARPEQAQAFELPLPTNLRALIDKRLSRLSADALKLARVAALAGTDFSVDLAAAVLARHPLDLLDAWRELEHADVMRDGAFAHDLILEVTRETVPAPLRQWLHGQIGRVLEANAGASVRLAAHWREAREPARAAASYMQAADAARATGRIAEESRWLRSAAECHLLAGNTEGRFEAMRRLAASATEAASPTEAMRAAHDLLDAAADDAQRGIAHKYIGLQHMNAASFDRADAELSRAIDHSDAAGEIDNANHARYLRILARAQGAGVADAIASMEALLPWAEALADEALRHEFLADLAILCDQGDQRRRARGYFERTLAYFNRQRQTANAATTRMMYGRSLMMLGDLDRAELQLEAALRDREELSEGAGANGIEALNLARVHVERGRYESALRLLEPSHERLRSEGVHVVGAAMALLAARAMGCLGQTARALSFLKQVPADLPYHLLAGRLAVQAALAAERPAERARLLDAAVDEFKRTDLPFVRLPIQFDQLACRDDDAALDHCRALIDECERRELPAVQMLGRARLVEMLHRRGRFAEALGAARALVETSPGCAPVGVYVPELHWICHTAARDAGDEAFAQHCLHAAARWIEQAMHAEVREPFRHSFLNRNPVNLRVLAAAKRL